MHKRKYILTILSIILCFALTACGIEATKPADKTETSETVKPSESETEGSQTTVEEPISEEEKEAPTETEPVDDRVHYSWNKILEEYPDISAYGKFAIYEDYGFAVFTKDSFRLTSPVTDDSSTDLYLGTFVTEKQDASYSIMCTSELYDVNTYDAIFEKLQNDASITVSKVVINDIPFLMIEAPNNNMLRFVTNISNYTDDESVPPLLVFTFAHTNVKEYDEDRYIVYSSIQSSQTVIPFSQN